MKRYLRELKPSVFDDIIAMVALYRPGPMQWIDDFIDRKHGRTPITYVHPSMENSLKNTYGVLVYQEQVMQISKEVSGFTGGEADTLRKAIGKKNVAMMAKMKTKFIEGPCQKCRRLRKKLMEDFWGQPRRLCRLLLQQVPRRLLRPHCLPNRLPQGSFPSRLHGGAAHLGFRQHRPHRHRGRRNPAHGLKVLPPDVNESFLEFAVVKDTGNIRFGLSAIKNVGMGAIEAICWRAQEGGPFTTVEDFAKRVNAHECNKKVWESLAKQAPSTH
jgi:DNA polymerase-3 subunit alpha